MPDFTRAIAALVQSDRRYRLEAYLFVQKGLSYAQRVMGWGDELPSVEDPEGKEQLAQALEEEISREDLEAMFAEAEKHPEQHLSGQQLCQALRRYAQEEYGLMAKVVLNSWGIYETGDFGEIVYKMIGIGLMRKSREDRREDFDDIYDFEHAFEQDFQITISEEP